MASNALPNTRDALFSLCDDLCHALREREALLGVKQNTEAVLRAALASAQAAEEAYGVALVARKAAHAVLIAADGAGRALISNARRRLSKFFGEFYTLEWGAAGWPNLSTGMPGTQDERCHLVASLVRWFTLHPEHESADMEATAQIAQSVYQAIREARAVLAMKTLQAAAAKQARDAAEVYLRKRAKGLVHELETLLEDDDPHWHGFGLNRPADPVTPEAPEEVTVTEGQPGMLLMHWEPARRARHYRVWTLVVGQDEGFSAVLSPSDRDATLTGLPSGATVRLRATAVNRAGESPPGPVVEVVVP